MKTIKNKQMKTKVSFHVHSDDESNEVFAFFPDLNPYPRFKNSGFGTSYAHIGQHSTCSPAYVKECRKATHDEYKDLLWELTEIVGYENLEVI